MNREAVQTRFTMSKPKSALLHVSRAQRADATADDTLGSRINLCRNAVVCHFAYRGGVRSNVALQVAEQK